MSKLTEAEVEARNAEFKIAELVMDDACVYIYRGALWPQCTVHDTCTDECSEESQWIVEPGDQVIVEVYDRSTESVFFEVSREQVGLLAMMFGEVFANEVAIFAPGA